ncbi:winged helix-turn-helix domain-containing protein [Kitasatospora sp. NPDC059577]|uniref:winged helix-turn-helix domain-containing protein n=1 Tax=Kitasatospora sp. NPDC059577 TaxID=3346873 RepID=UPI0036BE593C
MTEHPTSSLDDVVHQRVRLGILAVAREARRVEFTFLRTTLGLTAGNLSQHLGVLEKAGLVTIDKGYEGKRARTWIQLTKDGKKALHDEIATLKTLIHQLEGLAGPTGPTDLAGPADLAGTGTHERPDGEAAPRSGAAPAPG